MTWEKTIEDAKSKGKFDTNDMANAVDWHTCAVGEKFFREIPDSSVRLHGANGHDLLTQKARDLGEAFYQAVKFNQFRAAKSILKEINGIRVSKQSY